MTRPIEQIEQAWKEAIEREDTTQVEQLVREVLREHPLSRLACEIRYQRGMLTLLEGEGTGMERLAKALAEFEEGCKAGEKMGEQAEPWRTLNRTQFGVCMARRGNIQAAEAELRKASLYRPRTVAGLGALAILSQLLREADKPREAKRYDTQRLSYARALVREHPEPPERYMMQYLLCQELLGSEYAEEGRALLAELSQLSEEDLGAELFADIQALREEA